VIKELVKILHNLWHLLDLQKPITLCLGGRQYDKVGFVSSWKWYQVYRHQVQGKELTKDKCWI